MTAVDAAIRDLREILMHWGSEGARGQIAREEVRQYAARSEELETALARISDQAASEARKVATKIEDLKARLETETEHRKIARDKVRHHEARSEGLKRRWRE